MDILMSGSTSQDGCKTIVPLLRCAETQKLNDLVVMSPPLSPTNVFVQTKEEISEILIPNHSLRRLIHDLLAEGGKGLVYPSSEPEDHLPPIRIAYEEVMQLKCLGPPESELFGKTVMVTRDGVTGGRRRQSMGTKESLVFTDSTVSRRHFEIGYIPEQSLYYIQDLGSAGGTYIRLPFAMAKGLSDGVMILVGKHQFIVLSPQRAAEVVAAQTAQTAQRAAQEKVTPGAAAAGDEVNGGGNPDESQQGSPLKAHMRTGAEPLPLVGPDGQPQLVLLCFAPDGSPMQTKPYEIGREGATIGRKQTNQVSLSQGRGEEVVGLDSAVSGEHCRIVFNEAEQCFELEDGNGEKGSTNGTWIRLSYVQQMSLKQALEKGDELLIGGILRFVVQFEKTLVERDVHEDPTEHSDDSGATSADDVRMIVPMDQDVPEGSPV
jgi:pSer/pThr/pTyr-binding forkhead associated (FHA) protein